MTPLSLVQLYSGGLAIYINFEFWSAGTSTGLWLKSYRVVAANHKLSWHFPFFRVFEAVIKTSQAIFVLMKSPFDAKTFCSLVS